MPNKKIQCLVSISKTCLRHFRYTSRHQTFKTATLIFPRPSDTKASSLSKNKTLHSILYNLNYNLQSILGHFQNYTTLSTDILKIEAEVGAIMMVYNKNKVKFSRFQTPVQSSSLLKLLRSPILSITSDQTK